MSLQTIKKEVVATVCDICQQEINGRDVANWAQLTRNFLSQPTTPARRLIFQWRKLNSSKTEVKYDFHAECLYKVLAPVIHDGEPNHERN